MEAKKGIEEQFKEAVISEGRLKVLLRTAYQLMNKMVTDTNFEAVAATYQDVNEFLQGEELLAAIKEPVAAGHVGFSADFVLKEWPDSTSITSTSYDDKGDLAIVFKNGNVYTYHNVPVNLWGELVKCKSIGQFYAMNIKTRFSFTKQY